MSATGGRRALSVIDRAVLDVCADWPAPATLMHRIAALGLSPTRYFQRLNALLDDPAALVYAPMLVNRLRMLRRLRVLRGRLDHRVRP